MMTVIHHDHKKTTLWWGCMVLAVIITAWNAILTVSQVSFARQIENIRAKHATLQLSCQRDQRNWPTGHKTRNTDKAVDGISQLEDVDWFKALGNARQSGHVTEYQTILSRLRRDASQASDAGTLNGPPKKKAKNKKSKTHGAHFVAHVDEERIGRELAEGKVSSIGNFTDDGFNLAGVYKIWKAEDYSNKRTFKYDSDTGKVTIAKSGLYLVYAQVMFHGSSARKSYGIHINDETTPFVESLSFDDIHHRAKRHLNQSETQGNSESGGRKPEETQHTNATIAHAPWRKGLHQNKRHKREGDYNAYSQCNTLAVTQLRKNDKVFIKSLEVVKSIIARPYLTFFGLAKL